MTCKNEKLNFYVSAAGDFLFSDQYVDVSVRLPEFWEFGVQKLLFWSDCERAERSACALVMGFAKLCFLLFRNKVTDTKKPDEKEIPESADSFLIANWGLQP